MFSFSYFVFLSSVCIVCEEITDLAKLGTSVFRTVTVNGKSVPPTNVSTGLSLSKLPATINIVFAEVSETFL